MTQTKKVCGVLAAMAFLAVPYAHAQAPAPATSKIFASVNMGAQLAPRTLAVASSQTVYDETATLNASIPIGKGFQPDFGAGYRVWGNVFVGVTISYFTTTSTADITAKVPDPLFFDRAKTTTSTQTGLKHSELAVIPQVIYSRALTDKIDFVGGIGPAIVRLSQDSVSSFTVAPGTQNIVINNTSESASGTGVGASIGLNYNLDERLSIGALIRYAPAKVQLPSAAAKQNVGGMQAGGGIRVNF